MHEKSSPTYIITQEPGMVPKKKGPFYTTKMVEEFLREAYKLNPQIICIVIDMEAADETWYPEHGHAWLDIYGDRRRRHPRKDRPTADTTPPAAGTALTNDQKEMVLLRVIADMGGEAESSDSPHNWLNWFCSDEVHGKHSDTFNRCIENGWLASSHNSDFDTSTTWLTLAGRAVLSSAGTEPEDKP